MTEEELKIIWQTDQSAPMINYAALETSLITVNNKLRRRVKREITYQASAVALTFLPVFFYPRLLFFALFVAAIGAWYIPELAKLYRQDDKPGATKSLLDAKLLTMQRFFTRTRIANYLFGPVAVPLIFYAMGLFDKPQARWMFALGVTLTVYEILIITVTEIYFAWLYTPALKEVTALRQELDFE